MPAVRALLAAVAFLTRIPVRMPLGTADVARGAPLFPLVGAGIGAAVAGIALLAHRGLSPLLSAALAIAFLVALTGALHLDALADTADAVGATTRERALEVMRDSRIGSFGAAALAAVLLVRAAVLAQLLENGSLVSAAIAAGALSRGASCALAGTLPYARSEGAVLVGRLPLAAVPVALVVALAAASPYVALAGAVATVLLGVAFRAWLGGVTGDTLGAASELTELTALVVAAALR